MGAGVLWSLASLEASEGAFDFEAERPVRCRNSVTRNDVSGWDSNFP
jgi:hypothetical protein